VNTKDTAEALKFVAKHMGDNWDKNALTSGASSPRLAIGYIIMMRVGCRLHPDHTTKKIAGIAAGMMAEINAIPTPPLAVANGSLSLWLMNQGGN
jgi:hypothetical protein